MKVFVFFAVIAYVSASSYGGSSGSSSGGSSYGGSTMPALPCPKNYMFSCQPSLSPAPCSQASYGSAGAYSEPVPNYYGVPVNYPVNYPFQGVNGFYGYGQGVGVQDYRY